jgi:methionyl-tRNA formyltransferase
MSNAASPNRLRLLFFGMRCAFSAPPLAALIDAGCDLLALVLPAPFEAPPLRFRPSGSGNLIHLPIAGAHPGVDELAERADIPILEIGALDMPEVIAALRDFRPDAIVVACFPWLIPANVRQIPRLGCLNLHPSLLPRWRGSEPLFWMFKAGDSEGGITVHYMDRAFDTGPILLQERILVPDGVDGRAFEQELSIAGGELLVEAIAALAGGSVSPVSQDEKLATMAPMPIDRDLVIRSDQPARRVFNQVRGIAPLWGPLTLHISETGAEIPVSGAVTYEPEGTIPVPFVWSGRTVRIRCAPGVAQLTSSAPRYG